MVGIEVVYYLVVYYLVYGGGVDMGVVVGWWS